MFFTRLRKPKHFRVVSTREITYTRIFHVFSDTITDYFYMNYILIQKENGKYLCVWEKSGYPLTPAGIYYNLDNRFLMFREVLKLNWKTRKYRKEKIVS